MRNARGNPDQPLALDEIERKFDGNVGTLVPADVAASLLRGNHGGPDHLTTVALLLA